MESIDPLDRHLDPQDGLEYADCEVCGERHDLGDMTRVGQKWEDRWVCDTRESTCLDEWNRKNKENEA